MTVKEGEREGVSLEEKMKLLNPLLTSKYHEHLIKSSQSDKASQSCLAVFDMWVGVNNLAETIFKLHEAMDKKFGNEKKGDEKKDVDTKDVHLHNQVD